MAREGFRFVDLPKELRLNVYDHLLDSKNITSFCFTTRLLQKFTYWKACDPDGPTVSLILPGPITPIHLVCKALLLEAGAFIKLYLERKGLAYTAPRIIIRTRLCTAYVPRLQPLLHDILGPIFSETQKNIRGRPISHVRMCNAVWIATDRKPSSTELKSIQSYIEYAARFATEHKISRQSRYAEAEKLLSTQVAQADSQPSNMHGAMSEPMEKKNDLLPAPAVNGANFQIVVHMEYLTDVDLHVRQILHDIHRACDFYKTRVGVRIFGTEDVPTLQPGNGNWMKYEGHIDEKTWLEEWA